MDSRSSAPHVDLSGLTNPGSPSRREKGEPPFMFKILVRQSPILIGRSKLEIEADGPSKKTIPTQQDKSTLKVSEGSLGVLHQARLGSALDPSLVIQSEGLARPVPFPPQTQLETTTSNTDCLSSNTRPLRKALLFFTHTHTQSPILSSVRFPSS
ncbi:hypothetical protein IE53DRAFT_5974 [Violaceomyces palustris]|uniref:Uncharacterized protein n=1 Tax=Violaceomyces palustris TaxID=1673888 RepID=A0ACD0P2I7_9BASI|nr:hypothetical protein IE53DRAFT_5974 [Violaceomyces palustris]